MFRYAKKHLSNGGEELLEDLKSAMALLAFSPDTNCKKYKVSIQCTVYIKI